MKKIIRNIILLSSLILIGTLNSCSNEKDGEELKFQIDDEVPVNIEIEGMGFDINDLETSTRSIPQPDTISFDLSDGWTMETILETSKDPKTRGTVSPIKKGSNILIFALRNPDSSFEYLYKSQVVKVGDDNRFSLSLPNGERFKLLCYTYNDQVTSFDYTLAKGEVTNTSFNTEYFSNDSKLASKHLIDAERENGGAAKAAWATYTIDVNPQAVFRGLRFKQLFSRVELILYSMGASNISEVNAEMSGTQGRPKANVNFNDGSWTEVSGDLASPIGFDFTDMPYINDTHSITSNPVYLIPKDDKNNQTTVKVNSFKIGDKLFNPSVTVSFNQDLQRGYRYNVTITIKRNLNTVYFTSDSGGTTYLCDVHGDPTTNKATDNSFSSVSLYTGESWKFKTEAKANCEFVGWYKGVSSALASSLQTEITNTDVNKDVYVDKSTNMLVIKSTKATVQDRYIARYRSTLVWANYNLKGKKDGTGATLSNNNDVDINVNTTNEFFHANCLNTKLDKTLTSEEKGDPCSFLGTGWRTPTQADFQTLISFGYKKEISGTKQYGIFQKTSVINKQYTYGNLRLPMGGVYWYSGPGVNDEAKGYIQSSGTIGYYWTQTSSNSSGDQYCFLRFDVTASADNWWGPANSGALNIRCVKENP